MWKQVTAVIQTNDLVSSVLLVFLDYGRDELGRQVLHKTSATKRLQEAI